MTPQPQQELPTHRCSHGINICGECCKDTSCKCYHCTRSRPAPSSAPTDNGFDEQKFRDELSRYLYRYVDIQSAIQREVFERDIISCARGCVYPVPIDIATICNQTLDELDTWCRKESDNADEEGDYVTQSIFCNVSAKIESLRREVPE